MADDYGDDMAEESGMDSAAPSTAQENDEAPEKEHAPEEDKGEKEEGAQTALVPKSLFGEGVKPGTVCRVKIESVHEDEVEVSWVKDDSESKPKSNMEESEGALDRMAAAKE